MIALPSKLSDLLELAVSDAQKCEALPELFRLDMEDWAVRRSARPEVCVVCMAGAVMLQSLGFEVTTERLDPAKVGSNSVKQAMWAIDSMREGEFQTAHTELAPDVKRSLEQTGALTVCSDMVEDERRALGDEDDEDGNGELADRASWATYLKCAELLRQVGL